MAYSEDLARTKTWGNEILTAADLHAQLDLIIDWLMASVNATTGHKHDGTANESQKIDTGGIDDDAITFALIDDDGNFGLFTGDWSFNEIALVEDTAPSTAAGEGKLYTKDTAGQPELFFREESDGDEVQVTKAGAVDTTVNANLSGNQFGAWDEGAPWANSTSYLAATDGFVVASHPSGAGSVYGYTDSSNPPTTLRTSHHDGEPGGGSQGSIIMPVRKGDYWKVISADTIYWIPLGS